MEGKSDADAAYEKQLMEEYEKSLITVIGDLTFQPPQEVLPKTKRTERLNEDKMKKLKERKEEEQQKLKIKEQEEAQKRMKEQQQKKQKQQEEMKKREEERRRREEEEQRKQLEGGLDRILESLNANNSNPAIGLCGIELGSVRLRLLAKALEKNTSCMSIDFGRKQLNDEDGVSLADMLKVNKHLEKLELEGNNLGIKTGLALGEALTQNDSLRCLNLESNNITSSGNDQKGIVDIAEALQHNRSLRVLNLARNHITVQGGDYLVKSLQHNETITLIDLSGNELGIDQLRQVDAIVQRNRERLSLLRRRERQERFKLFNEEFSSRQYDMEVEAERLERDAIEERRLQRMRQRFLDWRTDCEERIKGEQEMYENLLDEAKDRAENRKGKKGKKKKK